jgi:hypothetical protein
MIHHPEKPQNDLLSANLVVFLRPIYAFINETGTEIGLGLVKWIKMVIFTYQINVLMY